MGPCRWAPGLGKPLAYPSHAHTKCHHENLKKQMRETSHFQAINEEKAGILWHSTSGKQFSELLLPPQGEGAAQRFGNFCSWALGSSQGAAPHGCVPGFSFWDQGWQVVLVSHPRQPLSPAGRLHPVLKTPQLLPQLPLVTGELRHTQL